VADRIAAVRAIVNPDKLRHIENSGNFGVWLKRLKQLPPSG
jgi:hypothetical protein